MMTEGVVYAGTLTLIQEIVAMGMTIKRKGWVISQEPKVKNITT
jgi:hypothetical protein